jgi:UDP-glucose 4-epimerase
MTRVLITGASGFIGSYLVQHLTGFEIKTLSLKHPDWIEQPFACDVIIHCAGLAHSTKSIQDSEYYEVNCELTKALLQKAIESNVSQFIFLSTALVFGEGHVGEIQFNSPLNPQSAYAKSKVCAEEALQTSNQISTCILRLPLMLGPEPKGNVKALATMARWSPIFLKIYNKRSLLQLDDLTNVVQEVIATQTNGILHSYSVNWSTTELYQHLRGKKTLLIPLPGFFLKVLRKRSRLLSKLMGDSFYNKDLKGNK